MEPSYGASDHYLSEKGEQYFQYQNKGMQTGRIESRKFAHLIKPSDCVLDFGCGNGSLLLQLNCAKRIGIDINPHARDYCLKQGIQAFATLHQVDSESVDIIISNHALEHIPTPLGALQEMRRPLLAGGRLFLCLPYDDWRSGQRRYRPGDINRHFYTWTPQLIGNLLEEAGFQVAHASVYTHAWPPRWQWLDEHLPLALFDLVCRYYAWKVNRRQVFVEAFKA